MRGATLIYPAIQQNRLLFIVLGIAMIVMGAIAIASPFVTTVAGKIFFGWLLLANGILQIVAAFSAGRRGAFFLDLLLGGVFVAAGAWLAFYPLTGVLTLTVFLGVAFVVHGILESISAFRMRPTRGWGWILTAGILAVVVGLLILSEFPSSALWAIGMLIGINFICSGATYVLLALTPEA
jgi:uncharacterized membrane protein HdeD (DUF308 family)